MNWAVIGAMLNSALYLVCVFAAGMMQRNGGAWKMAIVAFGVTYLSYLAWSRVRPSVMADGMWVLAVLLTWISIMLGAFAGVFLFV